MGNRMSNLVSVIVPIYKTEKYLRRCLDSIVNQTYKDLEIILVDDGSPDNCPVICDEYAKKDSRVKIIHQKNAGVSVARNTGIDTMSGDYVAFVDSDDWIDDVMIERLMNYVSKYNLDMAKCSTNNSDPPNTYDESYDRDELIEASRFGEMLVNYFDKSRWRVPIWNGVYRADIVKKCRFCEGLIYEDTFWGSLFLYYTKRMYVTAEGLYHYRKTPDSIVCNLNKRPLDLLQIFCLLKETLAGLGFNFDRINHYTAKEYYLYVYGDNMYSRPCGIKREIFEFVYANLNFRRKIKFLCSLLWKGIRIM